MLLSAIRGGACRLRWAVAAVAVIAPFAIPGTASASNTSNAESLQYISTTVAPVAGSYQKYYNQAVAGQTSSGHTAFSLNFKIPVSFASEITADNNATASASNCDSCYAIAISVQTVVAAKQNLAELTAHDVAHATNNCTNCEALAEAFQIVYAPYGINPMSWMIVGYFGLLRAQLWALEHSGLGVAQIQNISTQLVANVVSQLEIVSEQGSTITPALNYNNLPTELTTQPLIHLLSAYQG